MIISSNLSGYDWIQWYTLIVFTLCSLVAILSKSDTVRTPRQNIINIVFALPYIGRALGWW